VARYGTKTRKEEDEICYGRQWFNGWGDRWQPPVSAGQAWPDGQHAIVVASWSLHGVVPAGHPHV
jgi:hypothetical protein